MRARSWSALVSRGRPTVRAAVRAEGAAAGPVILPIGRPRGPDCGQRTGHPTAASATTGPPDWGQRTGPTIVGVLAVVPNSCWKASSTGSLRRSVGLGSTNGPGQEADFSASINGRPSSQFDPSLRLTSTSAQVQPRPQLGPVEATSSTVIKRVKNLSLRSDRRHRSKSPTSVFSLRKQQDQDAHHSTALGGQERSAAPGWARVAGWALRASEPPRGG
jgi:hypothetical protein